MNTLKNVLIERITTDNQNYTKISNLMIKDKSISPQAKGVLVYLLTLSNNCTITASNLAIELNTSSANIRKCLEELENANYIHLNTEIKNKPQHVILQYTSNNKEQL